MSFNIAIVNSSSYAKRFPEHLARLEKLGTVTRVRVDGDAHGKELAEALAPYDVVIASVTPFFDEEFFEYKKDLKLLSRHGIGYNNVNIPAARAAGTLVTTIPPLVERDAVAECTVAILMSLMRRVVPANIAANDGRWAERASFVGNSLSNKTLGIIGCGNIGSRVVEILKRGFDMNVLCYDPKHNDEWAQEFGVTYTSLDEVLKEADILTLNADLNPTSFHILGKEQLASMKDGVYVVDTARADLIDQEAMLDALESGKVKGLAIDVMHSEPPAPNDPYFNHPKVQVTTHIAAYTEECLEGMGDKCTADVERLAQGAEPVHAIFE